jgi:hypothetical protein
MPATVFTLSNQHGVRGMARKALDVLIIAMVVGVTLSGILGGIRDGDVQNALIVMMVGTVYTTVLVEVQKL